MKKNINSKKVVTIVFLFFIIGFCESASIFGQDNQNVQIIDANNCESNKAYFDSIANLAEQIPSAKVIIIARLGNGETSRIYNRRRLYEIRRYLEQVGVPKESIITAQGDRIRGRGRVEVYYRENLQMIFTVRRRQSLLGRECGETG